MKDLLSWQSFLLFASMLVVTYSTRFIGFFALRVDFRHRALFRFRQTARVDCHCADRACRKQVFHVGYRVDRRRQFRAVGVFNALGGCV